MIGYGSLELVLTRKLCACAVCDGRQRLYEVFLGGQSGFLCEGCLRHFSVLSLLDPASLIRRTVLAKDAEERAEVRRERDRQPALGAPSAPPAQPPARAPTLKLNLTATHPYQEVPMTSSVIIASMPPEPGDDPILEYRLSAADEFQPLSPSTQQFTVSEPPAGALAIGRGALHLRRARDGWAWIINPGPRPLQVRYRKDAHWLGPHHDYLLPLQAKEIGGGPGVSWVIGEAS